MRTKKRVLSVLFSCLILFVFNACVHVGLRSHPEPHRDFGPPPHAPAHGYRHKNPDGIDLVFDSRIGVYVSVGHPHLYYSGGRYFRFRNNRWEISVSYEGTWRRVSEDRIPPGLKKRHNRGRPGGKEPERSRDRPGRDLGRQKDK